MLVGRPNVGKSTLFNRITGTRRSIVTPVAGTTRDVIAQIVQWQSVSFTLLDTGGMFGATEDPLQQMVAEKGKEAITRADLLVVVLDGQHGLVPGDLDIVKQLRASGAPILAVVNKIDAKKAREASMQFYELGIDPMFEVSAEHGLGISDLLDEIAQRVRRGAELAAAAPEAAAAPRDQPPKEVSIAVIGRPNAGKSSLVNRLLREERMLVSEMPGTTRDAVDTLLKWHKRDYRIVDTAGIRRAGRVGTSGPLESLSVLVARRAIQHADVVVMVDRRLAGRHRPGCRDCRRGRPLGCGIVIAANKWDLMKQHGPDFYKEFDEKLRRQLKFLDYAPVMHISATTGERTPKLLETVDKVAAARMKRVPTPELNRFVRDVTAMHPPASPTRRQVRILYAAQTSVAPPTFVFFTNVATSFHFSYQRYLLNQLREKFGFVGTPLRIEVRRRSRKGD